MKKCKIGLDVSSIGYLVAMSGNMIISVCQVPQKTNISELVKQVTQLKPQLKVKGMKTKTQQKINALNDEILNCARDVNRVVEWLENLQQFYDIEIVNIERPIKQSFGSSSIQSFLKMAEYMGIMTTIFDHLEIPYNIIPIETWRSNFDYNKLPKEEVEKRITKTKSKTAVTREFAKEESVRIAKEVIGNIEDFWIPKGCRSINVDICESCLLALV